MQLLVKQTNSVSGEINIPGSKSHSVRALIIALLSNGASEITNLLDSDDVSHAVTICRDLGATISNNTVVCSGGVPLNTIATKLNSGNSGITTCFVLPILGLRKNFQQPIILDCQQQMRTRSINPLITALKKLGLDIEYINNDSRLPISVSGKLTGGTVEVDGTNSQYLSALLLALPCAPNDSEITVYNLQERPYVELTLSWLDKYTISYTHDKIGNRDVFKIRGNQIYTSQNSVISGDFSSASYAIAAASLLSGETIITGLNMQDAQGDRHLIAILQEMGADIRNENNKLIIRGGRELNGIKIDAADIPDLLPTLAVIGVHANGKTEIRNVEHARTKETDRIKSMTQGLKKLGANVTELIDGMLIERSTLTGSTVDGHDDHRTVMALSIAGLLATGETCITTAESINKTYPTFLHTMQHLKANMRLQND